MSGFPWLTLLAAVPAIGALVLCGMDSTQKSLARIVAAGTGGIALMLAAAIWMWFDRSQGGYQFEETYAWAPSIGLQYHLGLDGLGLVMVLLTAFLVLMAIWTAFGCEDRPALHLAMLLFLESGLFGTFTALNFIHWFFFWELSLVPAFLLIHLWGGVERSRAALQFFIYTMVGSIALLLAFLGLFLATGSFEFPRLAELARGGELRSLLSVRLGWHQLNEDQLLQAVCLLAFLGFAVKIPVAPFHTWLPLAYAEAPSSTTMVLTGLMSKMGVYGILRILMPIFPQALADLQPLMLGLAVLTVILPAFAAMAQRDIKRMFAYSSVNHLGYCLLGIAAAVAVVPGTQRIESERAAALCGVIVQMFNHGITAATLFCLVAFLERRSGGLRRIDDFGGLRKPMPVFAGFLGIAMFSSIGLPGLNGFVGEFLIFKGTFALHSWAAVAAAPGLLITAVFLLTFFQKAFCGPVNERWAKTEDLSGWERAILAPAITAMFVLGIYPAFLTELINPTVLQWINTIPP